MPKTLLLAATALTFSLASAYALAPAPDGLAVERRAEAMLGQLTLEQKIDLIGGDNYMFVRPVPSVGFPGLKMSDGPEGVRTWGKATAYAAGVALAAAWDPGLAERTGESMAGEARARGIQVLLAPGVNISRAPVNGRNFEYFGEDPYLDSRIAVGFIEGVQNGGVVATVKHFVENDSEYDRHRISADVDERTLREIYFPPFEAAVREAGVGAVMDSYNRINGVHATENAWLNKEILKKEWGFKGILMSDWEATYDGVAAVNGGLDLEMPKAAAMTRTTILEGIRSGAISVATLDDKVRRIFRTAIRFGFLEGPRTQPNGSGSSPAARAVALDDARESMVLLKNEGGLLPLNASTIRSIAVIGPEAGPAVTGGGGSSRVDPFSAIGIQEGISEALGNRVHVLHASGLPSPDEIFVQTDFDGLGGASGLRIETFGNPDFAGEPVSVRHVGHADHWNNEMWTPRTSRPRSLRWTGSFTAKKTGPHLILAGAGGRDRYTVLIDGRRVIDQPEREGQTPNFAEVPLEAGKPVSVQIDYVPASDDDRLGFGIRAVDDLISSETRQMAAQADVAVVCVGFNPSTESEGFDRSFSLPWGQDALISAVASANRRTIVTLTSGGAVDTQSWLSRVPALLELWYPGQEGGTALAEILFGARSPEGHLPISFDRTWEENPVHGSYYPAPQSSGSFPRVRLSEGVMLGYRYYTTKKKEPLFPFGFGLSYTRFAFRRIEAPPVVDSNAPVSVSVVVANTGTREGATVVQLYVGDPSAQAARPVRELKAFEKVRLNPGEERTLNFTLDRRSFSYFDPIGRSWRVDPGRFVLYAGDSSEDMLLSADVVVSR